MPKREQIEILGALEDFARRLGEHRSMREISLAQTKIEEAAMWLSRALQKQA